MADWQKIETAPKDGTEIIVRFSDLALCGYTAAVRPWKSTGVARHNGTWWESGVPGGHSIGGEDNQFTHWQPLPAPPTDD